MDNRLCISRDCYEEYILKVEEEKEMLIEHMSRKNIMLKQEILELQKKLEQLEQ
jgi:hypothetical protein